VLTGADIRNIRSAGLSALAGILMHWHGTCWEARFKTIACLLNSEAYPSWKLRLFGMNLTGKFSLVESITSLHSRKLAPGN